MDLFFPHLNHFYTKCSQHHSPLIFLIEVYFDLQAHRQSHSFLSYSIVVAQYMLVADFIFASLQLSNPLPLYCLPPLITSHLFSISMSSFLFCYIHRVSCIFSILHLNDTITIVFVFGLFHQHNTLQAHPCCIFNLLIIYLFHAPIVQPSDFLAYLFLLQQIKINGDLLVFFNNYHYFKKISEKWEYIFW